MNQLFKHKTTDLPTLLVIFGGAGDLAHSKLFPAIYNLEVGGHLPEKFQVFGFSRTKLSNNDYRESLLKQVKKEGKVKKDAWDKLAKNTFYFQGHFDGKEDYEGLFGKIAEFEEKYKHKANIVFYLATPPAFHYLILEHIRTSNISRLSRRDNTKIVIEKPFGSDLKSAEFLNKELRKSFKEEQIYRIDHYLGKETVQNILLFRFANQIFNPAWDRNTIDHIQISILESGGLDGRGPYYENSGAFRDIIQNHTLQLLANVAMERPKYFDEKSIRDERVRVMESLRILSKKEIEDGIVRGQYEGYRQEDDVNKHSSVETFVAMKLFIENDRWKDVPFYVRTGKKLKEKRTQIIIKFKDSDSLLIGSDYSANTLVYNIQPDEGVKISLLNKVPGKDEMKLTNLHLNYKDEFKEKIPGSYETLLLDVMRGDSTLFVRMDEIEASWRFTDHIRKHWTKMPPPRFPNYEVGSIGPREADRLIENDGRKWIN